MFISSPLVQEMYVHVIILMALGPVATQLNVGCSVELHSMILVGPDKMLGLSIIPGYV